MQSVGDVVRVQESESHFIGDEVYVEFCVVLVLLCVVGWEVWYLGELWYV